MGTIIDYGRMEDCFEKTKHVKSTLLYGDCSAIPQPWLTVFIPTYRRVDLLQQALDSVLRQWHTDFLWDIIIVDNEPYDGKANATERLIRKIDNPRILYYRNSENMRPGDNFNRGIFLARGKWVTMLHDDDLLIHNTLQNIGKLIKAYDGLDKKPLGAIAAAYSQFRFEPEHPFDCMPHIHSLNKYYCDLPVNYHMYRLTHTNVLMTSHLGGSVPSNGATYLRSAVLETGGFNDDLGISADLVLYYCIENRYAIYSTLTPLGFYRWGANTMIKPESTWKTIQAGYDIREYAYSETLFSRLMGAMFRNCHYRKFTSDVINERNAVSKEKVTLDLYDDICSKRPNRFWYFIYIHVVLRSYYFYKKLQTERIYKKVVKGLKK